VAKRSRQRKEKPRSVRLYLRTGAGSMNDETEFTVEMLREAMIGLPPDMEVWIRVDDVLDRMSAAKLRGTADRGPILILE